MTNARSATALATAALLLAAMTACAADGSDPPLSEESTTASPSTTSPTDASTSASTTDPSDDAAEAASAVVRDYFAVVDRLRQQPTSSLSDLKAVATGSELSAEQILIRGERGKQLRQVGDTNIAEIKVQSVNLDNSDPSFGKVPTAQVDVCWDVSEVDLIDTNGQSVVSPSRPDTGWIRFTVTNHRWSTDPSGGWRVLSGQDLEQTPCSAS